jgi:hypothetical protein
MRTRLLIAATLILIACITSGAVIYLLAGDEVEAGAYLIIGDTAYAVDPASSKAYTRQLERFGGKAAVLFDDINRWLASLWQGKRLGITIASLGAGAALVLFLIARRLPPD